MKKSIASPLLSAFVIPGLGQLINGQIIKGSILLGGITMLLVLSVFKAVYEITQSLNEIPNAQLNPELLGQISSVLAKRSHTGLLILFGIGVVVWSYSIIDAYINGKKLDRGSS